MTIYWVGNRRDSEKGTVLLIMLLYYIWLLNCINQYESMYFVLLLIIAKPLILIDRSFLWRKVLSYNINGKVFNIIRVEIYSKAKSCIRKENMISDYCMCNIGVRQGDNLYPVHFAPFINDFTEYVSTAYGGLNNYIS